MTNPTRSLICEGFMTRQANGGLGRDGREAGKHFNAKDAKEKRKNAKKCLIEIFPILLFSARFASLSSSFPLRESC
ncbi:hypothetical protein [Nevskia sp.]|uniref:hypothetical protein n=1 Tax=Nevskia sp. TaxID=1929292 RepID=UPI0025D916FC|nr:hypothetical protein [Nevskia sp.]